MMKIEPFAMFMDFVVYPVVWVLSPRTREHARYVKIQNEHLDGRVHVVPDMSCWYCRAREEGRKTMNMFPEEGGSND